MIFDFGITGQPEPMPAPPELEQPGTFLAGFWLVPLGRNRELWIVSEAEGVLGPVSE